MAHRYVKSFNFGNGNNYFPLPFVTSADNGKVLMVSGGNWGAGVVSGGSGGSGGGSTTKTAGLYDADGVMLASWDELVATYGFDIKNTTSANNFKTILNNNSTLAVGVELVISDSITSIGDYAFRDCTGLTSITIPDSVTSIGDAAFIGCTGLTSITIGNGIETIGDYAFKDCTGLTSITIPDSVTYISKNAFSNCIRLTTINVNNNNLSYTSVDGVLFTKDLTTLIEYPRGKQGTYIIPDGVTTISNSAFDPCEKLTSITIPDSVTSIGDYAFRLCTGLTSITIPDSVTYIGANAFSSCTGLTSVYFEHTTAPTFGARCFYKTSGSKCTFYFKNSTVANALIGGTSTTSHYNTSYGTKSTDYNW